MFPIVVMDHDSSATWSKTPHILAYRLPDDRRSFWTGGYPSAGQVRAFMCGECGLIQLYGNAPEA